MGAIAIAIAGAGGVFWLAAIPSDATLYNTDMHADAKTRTFTQVTYLHNSGWDEQITGVSATARGIVLTRVVILGATGTSQTSDRATFPADMTVRIETDFRVTDCRHPTRGPISISVHLRRWWLTGTKTIRDYGAPFPDAGDACGQKPDPGAP